MQNKFILLVVQFFIVITSCATKPNKNYPLWASYETIEAIYPNKDYIARIGYSKTRENVVIAAESEIGSYFFHTVHSNVKAEQTLSETKGYESEKNTEKRKIERIINIESINQLFDIRKTDVFFDRSKKQYICCAYMNRLDAWKIYKSIVEKSCNTFLSFYNLAKNEKEIIKQIRLYKDCEKPASDFLDKLQFSHLLLPESEDEFSEEKRLAENVFVESKKAKDNSIFYINAQNDTEQRLSMCVSQIISSENFLVSTSKKESTYEVIIDLYLEKTYFSTTMAINPGLNIVIKSVKTGDTVFSYKKNFERFTGFSEAEGLLVQKILNLAENDLSEIFLNEFKTLY